jgi:hypothetical protein
LDPSTTINHELKVYLLHKNDEIIFRSLYHSTVPFLAMICRSIAEYPPVILSPVRGLRQRTTHRSNKEADPCTSFRREYAGKGIVNIFFLLLH